MERRVMFVLILCLVCAGLAVIYLIFSKDQPVDPLTIMKEKLGPGDQLIQPEDQDWKEQMKLVDLDGDREKEAIGLIKFADGRLGVWMLKKMENEWQVVMDVRKKAQSIEHAYVGDYDGDRRPDLLIGWVNWRKEFDKTYGDISLDQKMDKSAEIYRLAGNKVVKADQMKYFLMHSDDFDQDGVMEIIELHKVPAPPDLGQFNTSYFNLHLYELKNNRLSKIDEVDFPRETYSEGIIQFDKGKLNSKINGVFLVYHSGGNYIVNKEVYTVKDDKIISIFDEWFGPFGLYGDLEIDIYSNNISPFRDIDKDGYMDIPATADANIEGKDNLANAFHRTFLNWYHLTEDMKFIFIAQQYDGGDFLFNFPKRWVDRVGVDVRDEDMDFNYVEGGDVYRIILRDKVTGMPVIRIGQVSIGEWIEKEKELKERNLRYEMLCFGLFDEKGQVYYAVLPSNEEVMTYTTLKELNLKPGEAKKNFISMSDLVD